MLLASHLQAKSNPKPAARWAHAAAMIELADSKPTAGAKTGWLRNDQRAET